MISSEGEDNCWLNRLSLNIWQQTANKMDTKALKVVNSFNKKTSKELFLNILLKLFSKVFYKFWNSTTIEQSWRDMYSQMKGYILFLQTSVFFVFIIHVYLSSSLFFIFYFFKIEITVRRFRVVDSLFSKGTVINHWHTNMYLT